MGWGTQGRALPLTIGGGSPVLRGVVPTSPFRMM